MKRELRGEKRRIIGGKARVNVLKYQIEKFEFQGFPNYQGMTGHPGKIDYQGKTAYKGDVLGKQSQRVDNGHQPTKSAEEHKRNRNGLTLILQKRWVDLNINKSTLRGDFVP